MRAKKIEVDINLIDDDEHEIDALIEYEFHHESCPEWEPAGRWIFHGYRIARAWLDGEKINPSQLTALQRKAIDKEIVANRPDDRQLAD